MSDVFSLKPCLVLGTGFHHWVLGDTKGYEPLVSWEALLRETASNMKIPWPDTTGNRLTTQRGKLNVSRCKNGYLSTSKKRWVSGIEPLACTDWDKNLAKCKLWSKTYD